MSDLSGCAKCVKYLLFLFNLLFLLGGLVLIAIGAISLVKMSGSGFTETGKGAAIFIIVIGSIVFIISFFGCAGAINNNHCMVVTFGVLLLLILVVQIAAVIYGFVMKDTLTKNLVDEQEKSQKNYGLDEDVTRGWNKTQEIFDCCGSTGYQSWNWSSELSKTKSVPDSCCKNITDNCGYEKNDPQYANELRSTGCSTRVQIIFDTYLVIIAAAAAAVALLELLGVIFAFCLANSLRKDYRVV